MNSLDGGAGTSEDKYRGRLRKGPERTPEADELTIPVLDAGSDSLGAGISNGLLRKTPGKPNSWLPMSCCGSVRQFPPDGRQPFRNLKDSARYRYGH